MTRDPSLSHWVGCWSNAGHEGCAVIAAERMSVTLVRVEKKITVLEKATDELVIQSEIYIEERNSFQARLAKLEAAARKVPVRHIDRCNLIKPASFSDPRCSCWVKELQTALEESESQKKVWCEVCKTWPLADGWCRCKMEESDE